MPQKRTGVVIHKTDWLKLPEHLRDYFEQVEKEDMPTAPSVVMDPFRR